MTTVKSFAPIEGKSAHVLILGSMPGMASLSAGEYYAHPQNTFWKIMGILLGIATDSSYEERLKALKEAKIALWDVLESCVRPGSMDAAIDLNTAKTNDIAGLLKRQPDIRIICFNGSTAENIFKRRVLPSIGKNAAIRYIRLPSTSPAHATISFESKVAAWRKAIQSETAPA